MAFYGKSRYNSYRKRTYNLTDNQRRNYANEMKNLEEYLQDSEWSYSPSLDSCYKNFENFELRLSNHSADNQYHNIIDSKYLLVNVKCSKLDFKKYIEKRVSKILHLLSTLDLSKYRFVNIVGNNVNCYVKGYKTKKEKFEINY